MKRTPRHLMWFGTREHQEQIPCPAIGGDFSSVGWSTKATYLNGGAFSRRSTTSHREAKLSWTMTGREAMQPLYDFAAGIYGDGPFFFVDPFAANAMPEYWASPGMATKDAPILAGETKPQAIGNTDMSRRYPSTGALYSLTETMAKQVLYVPVPPGDTFWIGAHGYSSGTARVTVTPFTGPSAGTPVDLGLLGVDTLTRVNASFSSAQGYTGVEIQLQGAGAIGLFGIVAQVIPNTQAPETGGWIGGGGSSGMSFESTPTKLGYSSALDLVGATATLIETEAWV